MRGRSVFVLLLVLALAPGWWWAWQLHRRVQAGEFTEKRLAFLQEENRRLTESIAARQQEQEAADDERQRHEIEQTVTRLRSLAFTKPVVYRQIPRASLPEVLRKKLTQTIPDQEFADAGVALAALGVLPPGTDLQKTYLSLLGEQVGAFYDQHTQELFTFTGQPLSSSQNRIILAHELTHALEDQHFHLANLPLEGKGNDDRAMAASALVEGDATLVMNQYMLGNLSGGVLRDTLASTLTTDLRQLAAAPRYLRESMLFPYLRGQVFCQTLYNRGGWGALAEAFRHPPSCTAQILHPERFLSQPRWEPVLVGYPELTVRGGKPASDNVLGEFGVRQLLNLWLKDEAAVGELGSAWMGDRYLVYGDAKANSYLWRSTWATADEARRFAQAARTGWAARHGLPIPPPDSTASSDEIASSATLLSSRLPNGRELRIVQDGRNVTLLEAQDANWLVSLEKIASSGTPVADSHVVNR